MWTGRGEAIVLEDAADMAKGAGSGFGVVLVIAAVCHSILYPSYTWHSHFHVPCIALAAAHSYACADHDARERVRIEARPATHGGIETSERWNEYPIDYVSF